MSKTLLTPLWMRSEKTSASLFSMSCGIRKGRKSYRPIQKKDISEFGGTLITSPPIVKEAKPFELPPPNDTMNRTFAYPTRTRGIDRTVLQTFADSGMIYESEKYHNAVFVGYDADGIPRHAHKRGTGQTITYKGNVDSSMQEYSFHWSGKDRHLCLFEAPIDMLGFISMHQRGWKNHSYAACCGVSDRVLWQMLADNPQIDSVYLKFLILFTNEFAKNNLEIKITSVDYKSYKNIDKKQSIV